MHEEEAAAAGKEGAGKANCHAKAVGTGDLVDADCLAKSEDKVAQAFVKAAAEADCVVGGDDAAPIGGTSTPHS